jgi:hypothetical protein
MNLLENINNIIYCHPTIMFDVTCGCWLGLTSNFGVNYMNGSIYMAFNHFSGELEKVSTVSLTV